MICSRIAVDRELTATPLPWTAASYRAPPPFSQHRDESQKHMIDVCGPETLCAWHIPTFEEQRDETDAVLRDDWPQGIPTHLLTRHADIIAAFGGGDESLQRKAFPTAGQISSWDVKR